MIAVAGAPVSFGVFELAPEDGAELPGPDAIAAALASSGYTGIDLGPVGFLGRGAELVDRLTRHGLALAGGWVDLPFHDDALFAASVASLDDALDAFEEAGRLDDRPAAKPTLAASSTPERGAHPGGGPGLSLTGRVRDIFMANVSRAADRVRERGFEPTFHHHAATFIETVPEIEAFLDLTDVDLTLDSGHLILGGGDPVSALRDWGSRINHVHIKDARIDVLRSIVADGGGLREVWSAGAFAPLGQADLDLDGFMTALLDGGYSGWLVVEQDVIPQPGDPTDRAAADQKTNRAVLDRWIP